MRLVCIEVLPAHSEIVHFYKIKAAGSSVKLFHQYNLGGHIGVHIGDYMPYNLLNIGITE